MERTVDGNASLEEQENTLNFAEKGAPLKLISYVRGEPHSNLATFERRDQGVALPLLHLTEVAGPQAGAVFTSDIWVGGVIKKVAGAR
jgi:hypothetical protein